jgi:hypothetical protein
VETDYYLDEDGTYEPPVPTLRAGRGNALPVRTTAPVVVPLAPRRHPLVAFGVGMLIVVGALLLFQQILVPFTSSLTDQWHYGDARITQFDADVGHGGISRFIAEVANGSVIVLELPLSDISKTRYYMVSSIISNNTPVVHLAIMDVNHDGKPDLIINVEGTSVQLLLYNTGTAFSTRGS